MIAVNKNEWQKSFLSFLRDGGAKNIFCNNLANFFELKISKKDFSEISKSAFQSMQYCNKLGQSSLYRNDYQKFNLNKFIYRNISKYKVNFVDENDKLYINITGNESDTKNDCAAGFRCMKHYFSKRVKNSVRNMRLSNSLINKEYINLGYWVTYSFDDKLNLAKNILSDKVIYIQNKYLKIKNKTPLQIRKFLNFIYSIAEYAKHNNYDKLSVYIGDPYTIYTGNSKPGDYFLDMNMKRIKVSSIHSPNDLKKYITIRRNIREKPRNGGGSHISYVIKSKSLDSIDLNRVNEL